MYIKKIKIKKMLVGDQTKTYVHHCTIIHSCHNLLDYVLIAASRCEQT